MRKNPVSAIEAALQAGLGGGAARPDLARRALVEADCPHLEAWLEAVARELETGAALIPADLVDTVAEKMLANRPQSLRAHHRIERSVIGALTRD